MWLVPNSFSSARGDQSKWRAFPPASTSSASLSALIQLLQNTDALGRLSNGRSFTITYTFISNSLKAKFTAVSASWPSSHNTCYRQQYRFLPCSLGYLAEGESQPQRALCISLHPLHLTEPDSQADLEKKGQLRCIRLFN